MQHYDKPNTTVFRYYLYYIDSNLDRVVVFRSKFIGPCERRSRKLKHELNGKLLCIGNFADTKELNERFRRVIYKGKEIC